MKNNYQINNNVAEIEILNHGNPLIALVDAEDLPLFEPLAKLYARYDKTAKNYYVIGSYKNTEKNKWETIMGIHRYLINAPKGYEVDHINHNTLDNRKCNLRVVTRSENQQNRLGCRSDNKSSGIRGVSWHKASQKWVAHIKVNGKKIHLGSFGTKEEAGKTAVSARARLMPCSIEDKI